MLILSCEWELYTNLLVLCMKNHSCIQQELLVNNYLNQVSGVENVLALRRNSTHIILHIGFFLCEPIEIQGNRLCLVDNTVRKSMLAWHLQVSGCSMGLLPRADEKLFGGFHQNRH